jgi:hypothetical protein
MSAVLNRPFDFDRTPRYPIAAAFLLFLTTATPFAAAGQSDETARAANAAKSSRAPYQAYLAADCLTGSNFCKFVSEAVPERTQLEVQRVACQGWHVNAVPPSFVVMGELRTSADAFVGRIDFFEARPAAANWGTVWAISEQTLMFIPTGHKLRITLNSGSTGVGSYGCTISGFAMTN